MERWGSLKEKRDFEKQERIRNAAPALLEALEEIYEMVQQNYHVDDNNMAAIEKAYAAIAAAKGEV